MSAQKYFEVVGIKLALNLLIYIHLHPMIGLVVYRDLPQPWTHYIVSAETHQIIEPWAEAKRRVLAICWEVGFWKNRVGFRMLIYNFVTEDRSETGPWSFSEI